MKKISFLLSLGLAFGLFFISGCGDDDAPPPENEEEVVDLVRLTFTPASGGNAIVSTATDPDGEGPEDFVVPNIELALNTIYILNIEVENAEEGEDITEEIKEEGDEHQFFFSWTGALFSSPTAPGNIGTGNEDKVINYSDKDENDLPIGLETTWQTAADPASGTFRILLKHQPGIKSDNTSFEDGESDIDLSWNIEIK